MKKAFVLALAAAPLLLASCTYNTYPEREYRTVYVKPRPAAKPVVKESAESFQVVR